jgi:hypothetical protein
MDFQDTFSNIVFQVTFKAILSKVRNLHHHVTLDIKETNHLKIMSLLLKMMWYTKGDELIIYKAMIVTRIKNIHNKEIQIIIV